MTDSLRILLNGLVDYAGLYPPAKLDMAPAVTNYASYLAGEHAWMLGRFVVPVSRLAEFEQHAAKYWSAPPKDDFGPWEVTALIGDNLDRDIDEIFAFNQRFAPPESETDSVSSFDEGAPTPAAAPAASPTARTVGCVIDTIELKSSSGIEIDRAMRIVPEQLTPFIEIPITGDVRGLITAMSGTGARAKVRTGGLTPDAFPAAGSIARFLHACASADVGFKATAGLHHPVRGEFNLTYEPACPRGMMYGFLNVFMAAALAVSARLNVDELEQVLTDAHAKSFVFDNAGATWRDRRIDLARLARVRESFAISFGSCSFEEPVGDLKALGLL